MRALLNAKNSRGACLTALVAIACVLGPARAATVTIESAVQCRLGSESVAGTQSCFVEDFAVAARADFTYDVADSDRYLIAWASAGAFVSMVGGDAWPGTANSAIRMNIVLNPGGPIRSGWADVTFFGGLFSIGQGGSGHGSADGLGMSYEVAYGAERSRPEQVTIPVTLGVPLQVVLEAVAAASGFYSGAAATSGLELHLRENEPRGMGFATMQAAPVPEPSTAQLLCMGLTAAGLALLWRRKLDRERATRRFDRD